MAILQLFPDDFGDGEPAEGIRSEATPECRAGGPPLGTGPLGGVAPRRIFNPPNPYESAHVEWLDLPPTLSVEVFEEECKSILSKNDSPDITFTYSVNPYRGCFHGCAYCYARPTHNYLQFGAGSDFESKLVVKRNAAEVLDTTLSGKKWKHERIVFSGNTDCYQPLEATYGLTRRCLEVCLRHHNPVSIITKGALIRRDIDVLQKLHAVAGVRVHMSIAFDDDATSKLLEPGAPRPSMRFKVLKELSEAGIPVSIAMAPIIPGLNDHSIPALLERARDAGATAAFMTLLRLTGPVREVFVNRIHSEFASRERRILHSLQEMRGGRLHSSEFGSRMIGAGAKWEAIEWLFRSTCERLGMSTRDEDHYVRRVPVKTAPQSSPQLSLGF